MTQPPEVFTPAPVGVWSVPLGGSGGRVLPRAADWDENAAGDAGAGRELSRVFRGHHTKNGPGNRAMPCPDVDYLLNGTAQIVLVSPKTKRLPKEVFNEVFGFILSAAAHKGPLWGDAIGIDSTTIRAKASMRSIARDAPREHAAGN